MKTVLCSRDSRYTCRLVTLILLLSLSSLFVVKAEDEHHAIIALSFSIEDSVRVCKALVTEKANPVKEVEVHFYIPRMFGMLPLGKSIKTDENGVATVSFPQNLPGDNTGNVIVIAKIEDDDTYGNVESKGNIKWGDIPANEDKWDNRSLSASRDKAPTYLIITSNLIIAGIWGTLIFIVFQIFKIRKSRIIKK